MVIYSGELRPGSSGVFSLNMRIGNILVNVPWKWLSIASFKCFLHVSQWWWSYDLPLRHNELVNFNLMNMQIRTSKQLPQLWPIHILSIFYQSCLEVKIIYILRVFTRFPIRAHQYLENMSKLFNPLPTNDGICHHCINWPMTAYPIICTYIYV